jgi:hypothetical protein
MTDVASPNDVEHRLLSDRASEKLEGLVYKECTTTGGIDSWPEHWEESGSIDVWRCTECGRLYFNARGNVDDIIVYIIEQTGLKQ